MQRKKCVLEYLEDNGEFQVHTATNSGELLLARDV
jgi:hypothetical protein